MQVLNLLGEKYLELTPKGSGEMEGGDTVPVSRTNGSYDIVATLSELTTTTEAINIPQLSQALTTLGDTVDTASPHIRSTFTGLSRISRAIATRDESIQQLLGRAERVTKLLSQRRGDLVTLMKQGELVFQELITRREAIHSLLVNSREAGSRAARPGDRQPGPDRRRAQAAQHGPEVPPGPREADRRRR